MRPPARFASLLLGGAAFMPWAAAAEPPDAPAWVIDPARPGDSLPPAGGSLFDALFAEPRAGGSGHRLPFPFEALLARVDAQLAGGPLRRVLIPLGRSLQRTAAGPEAFGFPRYLAAVDAEPAPGALLLKDRLYIGYQEKTAVLEVISYNEAAGRFEFQLVKDYRAGGRPQVFYANRHVCFACHQNGAPIFSRALWDETNANPAIAAQLAAEGRGFHGFAVARGVDTPYAIDVGVRRANRFVLTQRLWREGCGGGELGLPELQPAEGVKNTYYHGFTAQELDSIVRGNGCTVLYIQTLDDIFVQSYADLFTDKLAAAQSGETLLYRVTDAGFAPMPMEVSAQ